MSEYLYADELGIVPSDITTSVLPEDKPVTNGLILDLWSMVKKEHCITTEHLCRFLRKNPDYERTLKVRMFRLLKQKKTKFGKTRQHFLCSPFQLGVPGTSKEDAKIIKKLEQKMLHSEEERKQWQTDKMQLKRKITLLEKISDMKKSKISELKETISKEKMMTSHLASEVNKSSLSLTKMESCSKSYKLIVENEVKKLSNKVFSLEVENYNLSTQNKTLLEKVACLEKKVEELSNHVSEQKTRIRCYKDVTDLNSGHVQLYDAQERRFTSECEQCVMKLLHYKVPISNVGKVIQTVARLCGKTDTDKIPSESTVRQWNLRQLESAEKQKAEKLSTG